MHTIVITGGAGFIGNHVVRRFVQQYPDYHIICLDVLTYAGNLANLADVENAPNYEFARLDICDYAAVRRLLDGQRVAGNDSRGLIPKAVRPIANHVLVSNAAVSIYAAEYQLNWDSVALENGRFPEETHDSADRDYLFTKYKGELSAPYPPFEIMDGLIIDPTSGANLPHHFDLRKSDGKD